MMALLGDEAQLEGMAQKDVLHSQLLYRSLLPGYSETLFHHVLQPCCNSLWPRHTEPRDFQWSETPSHSKSFHSNEKPRNTPFPKTPVDFSSEWAGLANAVFGRGSSSQWFPKRPLRWYLAVFLIFSVFSQLRCALSRPSTECQHVVMEILTLFYLLRGSCFHVS